MDIETPLSMAAELLHCRDVIMALVDGGAMFDFRNRNGLTPVHKAARLGIKEALSVTQFVFFIDLNISI